LQSVVNGLLQESISAHPIVRNSCGLDASLSIFLPELTG